MAAQSGPGGRCLILPPPQAVSSFLVSLGNEAGGKAELSVAA